MMHVFTGYPRIMVDPEICFGKPCIKGTRIPVASILTYLSGGMSIDEMLKEFNWLTREDIQEAIAFAAAAVDYKIIPIKKAS